MIEKFRVMAVTAGVLFASTVPAEPENSEAELLGNTRQLTFEGLRAGDDRNPGADGY